MNLVSISVYNVSLFVTEQCFIICLRSFKQAVRSIRSTGTRAMHRQLLQISNIQRKVKSLKQWLRNIVATYSRSEMASDLKRKVHLPTASNFICDNILSSQDSKQEGTILIVRRASPTPSLFPPVRGFCHLAIQFSRLPT